MGARVRELNAHEGLASILGAVLSQASVKVGGSRGNRSGKNTPLIPDGKGGGGWVCVFLERLLWDFRKAGIRLDTTAKSRIEELN